MAHDDAAAGEGLDGGDAVVPQADLVDDDVGGEHLAAHLVAGEFVQAAVGDPAFGFELAAHVVDALGALHRAA